MTAWEIDVANNDFANVALHCQRTKHLFQKWLEIARQNRRLDNRQFSSKIFDSGLSASYFAQYRAGTSAWFAWMCRNSSAVFSNLFDSHFRCLFALYTASECSLMWICFVRPAMPLEIAAESWFQILTVSLLDDSTAFGWYLTSSSRYHASIYALSATIFRNWVSISFVRQVFRPSSIAIPER